MEKRGIWNFRYGSIYDSPDGVHFATRYAYSAEDIEELARLSGFKIIDVKRLPLETGQGVTSPDKTKPPSKRVAFVESRGLA
jgi:hypothetical protein